MLRSIRDVPADVHIVFVTVPVNNRHFNRAERKMMVRDKERMSLVLYESDGYVHSEILTH